jgi:hypothetical protein
MYPTLFRADSHLQQIACTSGKNPVFLSCIQLQQLHLDEKVRCDQYALIFIRVVSEKIGTEYATAEKKVHVFFDKGTHIRYR